MTLTTLLLSAALAAPPAAPPLPWFGEDKLKHFFASFVVTSLTASGARAAGLDRTHSIAVGAGLGAATGLWKEVRDVRAGGNFSGYDLVWDAAGVGAAALMLDSAR
ncbi:MAG: DUF2279 domain-containing protein [Gemmatimonadota bacterium]